MGGFDGNTFIAAAAPSISTRAPPSPKVHERKADLLDLLDIKGRESAKRGLARELRKSIKAVRYVDLLSRLARDS